MRDYSGAASARVLVQHRPPLWPLLHTRCHTRPAARKTHARVVARHGAARRRKSGGGAAGVCDRAGRPPAMRSPARRKQPARQCRTSVRRGPSAPAVPGSLVHPQGRCLIGAAPLHASDAGRGPWRGGRHIRKDRWGGVTLLRPAPWCPAASHRAARMPLSLPRTKTMCMCVRVHVCGGAGESMQHLPPPRTMNTGGKQCTPCHLGLQAEAGKDEQVAAPLIKRRGLCGDLGWVCWCRAPDGGPMVMVPVARGAGEAGGRLLVRSDRKWGRGGAHR